MSRTLGLLAGFAVALAAALTVWGALLWDASLEVGRQKYDRRRNVEEALVRKRPEVPLIAWLGDSTLLWVPSDVPPYPSLIRRELRPPRRFENAIVALPAHDAYHHYSLMGPMLDLEPEAVFIVANLRLFRAPAVTNFLDLASWIPPAELGRALRLPWHERGITLPRLLMAQALRDETAEEVFLAAEGLRELFQRDVLPPVPWAGQLATKDELIRRTLEDYTEPLSARHPVVRMLVAAVEMAERRGVRAVVLIPPMPIDGLAHLGIAVSPAEQAAVLRQAVESAGGELVALYDLLGPEDFRDEADHLTLEGATRVAKALAPFVESSLPEQPRSRSRVRGRRGRGARRGEVP